MVIFSGLFPKHFIIYPHHNLHKKECVETLTVEFAGRIKSKNSSEHKVVVAKKAPFNLATYFILRMSTALTSGSRVGFESSTNINFEPL
jgi:hypothetical protein